MGLQTVQNVAVLLALAGQAGLVACWDHAARPASSSGAWVPAAPASGGSPPLASPAALKISPSRVILTGVRGVVPVAHLEATLHNPGASALTLTAIALGGDDPGLFRIRDGPRLPATIAAGASLSLTLELLTDGALPPAPRKNDGGSTLSARLEVAFEGGSAVASVHGVLLTTVMHEPTLGQILGAAGIPLNVGRAQNNANPNTGGTATLPGVEAGTDEVPGGLFQKAGPGEVTLQVVARFSPKGPMPFGWYPRGEPHIRHEVATMISSPDNQTSDQARRMLPPVTGAPSFDPGEQSFGIWVYTDQRSQRFDVGGNAANGDYSYSEDAPNSPPDVHRIKVYPLKGAAGAPVANSYLLAVEEATNGDYQDYVFLLGNVRIAP